MTIAGTGHRPDKLGSYDPVVAGRLCDLAMACLEKYPPDTLITGMAQGWDIALARGADNLGIRYVAYVPFKGQELLWPEPARRGYHKILERAYHVEICSDGGYSAAKMQYRNQRMVDACDLLLALWNKTPGGTRNCVMYARQQGKKIVNVWKSWEKNR